MGPKGWIVAISGASGAQYGMRLVSVIAEYLPDYPVHVLISDGALRVLKEEQGLSVSASLSREEKSLALFKTTSPQIEFHNVRDIGASIASGSFPVDGMVICPCSMSSLGMIAHGCGDNLIHRAADVTLKERRPLILVPRETPLSSIHLENMLKLARAGATIVPAMPGFYHQPSSVDEIVDQMVMKVLDQMGIRVDLTQRWKCTENQPNGHDARSR